MDKRPNSKKIWGRTLRNTCKTGLSRGLSPNFPINMAAFKMCN